MSNKTLAIILIIITLALGVYALVGTRKGSDSSQTSNQSQTSGQNGMGGSLQPGLPSNSTTTLENPSTSNKTVNVSSQEFSFTPNQITVNKGDIVRIILTNNGNYSHDWVVDKFNVRTPVIPSGQTAEVTFVASQAGTFEYYCSVGNHRQMGMRGQLIVQ